jgi:osmotically-inducible protein OsmY
MKPMISDKILREAVLKELERDSEIFEKYISVTAFDGAIALGGHVMTIHERHAAVRAAQLVAAVKAVADTIEVREPSLHRRADDEIAEEVAHVRSRGTEIPDSVGAQVRGGRVILHGKVESASQRVAVRAVRQLTGVRGVDNLINVEARIEPTPADVKRRVREAIGQVADATPGPSG